MGARDVDASDGRADLHTHTTYSDGVLGPTDLVAAAAAVGLRTLGVTDHDTVAGLDEAEGAARRHGLGFVPGLELSTGDDGDDIHLLGYFFERTDPALLDALAGFARQRLARVNAIVSRLADAGVMLDFDRVVALAGLGTAGRPHVARALIEAGHVADIGEAFDRFLRAGRLGFVPRAKLAPERAIAIVRAAGGAPTLAHPRSVGDLEATLARLVPAGLVGLEVYYGEYDAATRADLKRTAERWDLVATGGSDFHGVGFKAGRDLGGPAVPEATVTRLRAAAMAVRAEAGTRAGAG